MKKLVAWDAEGRRTVPMLVEPHSHADVIAEVPNCVRLHSVYEQDHFAKVVGENAGRTTRLEGWVAKKNLVALPLQIRVFQAEGHPSVRVFEQPVSGARVVAELPNGSTVQCVDE